MHREQTAANHERGSRRRTVLLADDDAAIRTITSMLLERKGFEVLTAENGAAALALFNDNADTIDLVLTDISMPLMNGASLVSAILEKNPAMPFVASSGKAPEDHASKLGLDDVRVWLRKPYDGAQLLETIEKALMSPGHGDE